MAGRKRRASTSSVETVDEDQIRWLQETSVMRIPSKTTSTDDLPIFELRNAIVLNKTGETLENALYVADKGPYILRGDLIVEDAAQRSHLIMKVRSSTPLEVRNCVEYSIGESGDGRPVIWVRGRGAWYEIEPSRAYQPIYNKMCEATTLYYHMMDIYKAGGIKKSKRSKNNGWLDELSDIFLQYAVRVGDGSTFEEVVQRCGEHAFFFIWQFTQEDAGFFDWRTTGFYKWLLSEHPDLFKKTQKLITNPPKASVDSPRRSLAPTSTIAPRRRSRHSVSTSPNIESEKPDTLPTPPKQSPPKQLPPKHPPPKQQPPSKLAETPREMSGTVPSAAPSPTSTGSQPAEVALPSQVTPEISDAFESVLASLEWVYDMLSRNKRGVATVTALNRIYFAYKFPDFRKGPAGCYRKPVEETFHYNSKLLLQSIDKHKYEHHELYNWLQEMARTPFHPVALSPKDLPYQLVPRGNRSQAVASPSVPAETETDSSLKSQDQDSERTTQAPRGKRVPGHRGGKKSSLRLATTSQKRSRSALEDDSDSETVEPKRSHYFSEEDDEMDDAPVMSAGEEAGATDNDEDSDKEPIKLIIQAERVPSTIPLGPNGTWTCEEDDCDYIVRGGDDEYCQTRIREHFHQHERATRVTLAVAESRGHLPINHLLDKIKNLGERVQQSQQLSVNGVVLPQHIKRKLPI